MQEGLLPSFFNTADNLNYVGPYPEPKYYGADFMSGDERVQFLAWYEEEKEKKFSQLGRTVSLLHGRC